MTSLVRISLHNGNDASTSQISRLPSYVLPTYYTNAGKIASNFITIINFGIRGNVENFPINRLSILPPKEIYVCIYIYG